MAHILTNVQAGPRRRAFDPTAWTAAIGIAIAIAAGALLQSDQNATMSMADVWRGNSADLQMIEQAPGTVRLR